MNLLRLIVALLFLSFGLVIGFFNNSPAIVVDLLVFKWATTPGNAIILSLLTGVLVGGLVVFAAAVLPLHSKLRKAGNSASGVSVAAVTPRDPEI